jgi:uncharacterized protein
MVMKKTLLDIRVAPKSSRSMVVLDQSSNVKVYLNSPPVDGKANEECIRVLAKTFGIPKSHIEIERGASGRNKRIAITGLSMSEVMTRLRENEKSGK